MREDNELANILTPRILTTMRMLSFYFFSIWSGNPRLRSIHRKSHIFRVASRTERSLVVGFCVYIHLLFFATEVGSLFVWYSNRLPARNLIWDTQWSNNCVSWRLSSRTLLALDTPPPSSSPSVWFARQTIPIVQLFGIMFVFFVVVVCHLIAFTNFCF